MFSNDTNQPNSTVDSIDSTDSITKTYFFYDSNYRDVAENLINENSNEGNDFNSVTYQ